MYSTYNYTPEEEVSRTQRIQTVICFVSGYFSVEIFFNLSCLLLVLANKFCQMRPNSSILVLISPIRRQLDCIGHIFHEFFACQMEKNSGCLGENNGLGTRLFTVRSTSIYVKAMQNINISYMSTFPVITVSEKEKKLDRVGPVYNRPSTV